MIVIYGNIDEVVLNCLRASYPSFTWDYAVTKGDKSRAIGHTDKFCYLGSETGCIFDKVLNWMSIKGFTIFS